MALAPMVLVRGLRTLSVNTVLHSALVDLGCEDSVLSRCLITAFIILTPSLLKKTESTMAPGLMQYLLVLIVFVAIITPCISAQPPTADEVIEKDRTARQAAVRAGRHIAVAPKRGFFGTIFHVILEQINDTKSAYNQISELVNNQFADENAVTSPPDPSLNGTTETPKITRAEFLKILDRNLKGLNRLRNLEWREAKKDSAANIRLYKEELFKGKKTGSAR
ncbi:uncharacterized protein LOC110374068 isoform X1 [Helicoverpa armigera]|uniref:uncharacterized protein LOC110374068 isoform X1 n=2 Tax=Helicoverpa armigera TaxID=29058 RepID=UPI003082A168